MEVNHQLKVPIIQTVWGPNVLSSNFEMCKFSGWWNRTSFQGSWCMKLVHCCPPEQGWHGIPAWDFLDRASIQKQWHLRWVTCQKSQLEWPVVDYVVVLKDVWNFYIRGNDPMWLPKNMFNFIGKNIKHKLWLYRSSSVCSLLAIIGSTWHGNLDQSCGDVRGSRWCCRCPCFEFLNKQPLKICFLNQSLFHNKKTAPSLFPSAYLILPCPKAIANEWDLIFQTFQRRT